MTGSPARPLGERFGRLTRRDRKVYAAAGSRGAAGLNKTAWYAVVHEEWPYRLTKAERKIVRAVWQARGAPEEAVALLRLRGTPGAVD